MSSNSSPASDDSIDKYDTANIAPFTLSDAPESVGGNLDDDDAVQAAISAAVDFYHQRLPDDVRQFITEHWGISDQMIDGRKIGYSTGDDMALIDHLRERGFSDATILRAGLATSPGIKYVFGGDPDEGTWVDVPTVFDVLADARSQTVDVDIEDADQREHLGESVLSAESIDFQAVVKAARETGCLRLRDWWDNRIVFPYRNEQGEFTYLIGRSTEDTDDIEYGDGTTAKYVKQSVAKPWVNTETVTEPMFGEETINPDKALLITEGITDAIMAHQHGFPCIAPATTQFKKEDYPMLKEHAEKAEQVFIVNDSEVNPQDDTDVPPGLNGALKTATMLNNEGINCKVGELPRPDGVDKVDIAEFLKHNNAKALLTVLKNAVDPRDHPLWEEDSHDVSLDPTDSMEDHGSLQDDHEFDRDGDTDTTKSSSGNGSLIFDLRLEDVIDWSRSGFSRHTTGDHYRGPNFFHHRGDSEDYMRVWTANGTVIAKDFKSGQGFNALTWMACVAAGRDGANPKGSLSNEELFKVWEHAKTATHIPVPSDDPVPSKAMWYIARKYELAPESEIPNSFDDPKLGAEVYNAVLDTIEDEYGVDPGRKRLDPNYNGGSSSGSSGTSDRDQMDSEDNLDLLG